ncbi:MAG: HAD-IA family hydrolase [bacterium]|nr:HAD-IA family hydrolase [bacterium]
MQFKADALLFDLDGTLVDSSAALVCSWTQWAIEHGVSREAFASVATYGRTSAELIADLLPADRVAAGLRRIEEIEQASGASVIALPGAREVTRNLPPGRWAVVTSSARALAEARLRGAGLYAPLLVTADDVRHGKPDPEPFLLAAERLGVEPSRCVVFEDAPTGITAARAAGMRTVAVVTTYCRDDLHADVVITELRDVAVSEDGARLILRVAA